MPQASPLKDPVWGLSVTEQSPHRFEHAARQDYASDHLRAAVPDVPALR